MKKFLIYVVVALSAIIATNCSKKENIVYDDLKLSLTEKEVSLRVSKDMSFAIASGSGEYEVVSSDANVATVSLSGTEVTIKGNTAGEATITVLDKKSNQRSTIKVVISKELLELKLDAPEEVKLLMGETATVNITSGNGTYEVVIDPNIASFTLSQTTISILGVATGTTTATVKDVESGKEVSFVVVVTKKETIAIDAEGPVVVKAYTSIEREQAAVTGESLEKTKVKITSGSGGTYTVTSSDEGVAKVTISGDNIEIDGLKTGVATITISNGIDEPVEFQVNVYSLLLSPDSVNLLVNATYEVAITDGSGDYDIESNSSVVEASVSGDKVMVKGLITSNKKAVELIVKDKVSGKKVSLMVYVSEAITLPTESDVVFVKGGTFTMGSDSKSPKADPDEVPLHQVTLSDYKISKYEVTNEQYVKFLNAKGNQTEAGRLWYNGLGKNAGIIQKGGSFEVEKGRENYPVTYVTWHGAKAYAEWAGGRLPTEAQWEFASKGGVESKNYQYSGSDNVNEVGYHLGNSKGLNPVGTLKPNELGIYDMSGNAWEWTADRKAPYTPEAKVDPQPVTSGGDYVRRGASCYCKPTYCRSANRGTNNSFQNNIGFRVVFPAN